MVKLRKGRLGPQNQGQTLPSPRRAVQVLAGFLTAPLILLSVLCYPHPGLLAAGQIQQKSSNIPVGVKPVEDAIAEGKQLRDHGRLTEARAAFGRAVSVAQASNDKEGQAKSLLLFGVAQIKTFQYRAALISLQTAESIADAVHKPVIAGMASGDIATIYSEVGDWHSAEWESARAIAAFRKVPEQDVYVRTRLARALQSHAYMCFKEGRNAEGYRDSSEAISLAEAINDVPLQSLLWDIRGSALLREHNIPDAATALQTALSLNIKDHDIDSLPFIKEHLAELELERQRPDWGLALRLIDEACNSHSYSYSSHQRYIPVHIRAKILLGRGNKAEALSEFKHAVAEADHWRLGALPGDTTNTQTVAELEEVYSDYAHLAADIALVNNDNALAINALEVLAINRAASLREQLRLVYGSNWKLTDGYFYKLSQLQSAQADVIFGKNPGEDEARLTRIRLQISDLENQIGINPGILPGPNERIPRRNSLRDIQHKLSLDQVLISITLGKNQSYLWAVTGDRVYLSRLPAVDQVQQKALAFANAVRSDQRFAGVGNDLSRALFSGLPADVWNRSEWMLVVDGSLLTGIPFSALTIAPGGVASSSKPGRSSLIEGKSLRFLPSELLLLDGPPAPLKKSFVGIGDPIYNMADPRFKQPPLADAKSMSSGMTLARLAGSEREIRSAAKESKATDPLLLTGASATREKVSSALGNESGIVHFAVHVVSPPDQPQQAALALSVKNGMPELLTAEVIASFHTPGSLVVLSGCSSGQGKVIPGAGLVGLSRAWLLAGAAAVVVSNWPTPDDSGRFFLSFYSYFDAIKTGSTAQRAAAALRSTQLDLLRGTGFQSSPAFWGAFAVISKE